MAEAGSGKLDRPAQGPAAREREGRVEGFDEALARVRRGTPADSDKLVELMAHVPMEGSLVLATRRDPDFFALYDMQRGRTETFIYDDGSFAGMGAILVRDGWLDGEARKVGYLGDLRMRGNGRARRAFPAMYGHFFADHVAKTGCDSFLTAVLASNALAIQSLARRKKRRAAQPYYHLMRRYEMASIQLLRRRRPQVPSGLVVVPATPDDLQPLAAFLDADHRRRPFGYRFDDGELEHRLARWPGFRLEDTLVARVDDGRGRFGRIVGCATLWDAAPVKRYRVMRYGGEMRAVKLGVSLASKIFGCPPLPEEGQDFRSLYLTNLSVEEDNPVVLRGLLEHAYVKAWERRVHFFSLPLYMSDAGEPDPLSPALRAFVTRRLGFHLYAVTSSDRARTSWPAGRPGFEMALA